MEEKLIEAAGPWLELGIVGAALFIILVVVVLMFWQQGKSIDKLCLRIDDLITGNTDTLRKLDTVITCNDKDQKEMIRLMSQQNELLQDSHKRIVRIDTRLYNEKGNGNNGRRKEQDSSYTGAEHRGKACSET